MSVWNSEVSKLEKELNVLRESKKVVKEKVQATVEKSMTDDEIHQKKIEQKIKQIEKEISKLTENKPVDNKGKKSIWSSEISALKNKLNDLRDAKKESLKLAKKSESEKNDYRGKVKQALIDKGFFREITVKGVVKKVLDY